MKKLLTILGAVGLTATTGATVVACSNSDAKSIKDATVSVKDGDAQTTIEEAIKTAMTGIVSDAVLGTDYKIKYPKHDGDTYTAKAGDKITVTTDKKLKGKLTIEVEAAPTSGGGDTGGTSSVK